MFLADTEREAREALKFGYEQISDYLTHVLPVPRPPHMSLDERIDAANASGAVVIGTADRAIEQIQRLVDQSGGFGTYLLNGGYWANLDDTLRSYQIFAEQVMPHFNGQLGAPTRSYEWTMGDDKDWDGQARRAVAKAMDDYAKENPDYVAEASRDPERAVGALIARSVQRPVSGRRSRRRRSSSCPVT